MSYVYLALTDDTTTISLTWNQQASTSYLLRSWPTAIAALNPNELGFAYADVEEDITLDIFGDSVSAANDALLDLTRLLDQADRWWRGDVVDPVYLDCWPDEGQYVWRSMVLGRARRDETSGVRVAPTYQKDAQIWAIQNIRVRLHREGIWRTKTTIASGSPPAVANPFVQDYSLTNLAADPQDAAPTQYILTGITTPSDGRYVVASNLDYQKSIMALCARPNTGNAIVLFEAQNNFSSSVSNSTITTVADAASNLPASSNVLRISSTSIGNSRTGISYTLPNTATWQQARRVQIFLTVRTTTTNVQWRITENNWLRWNLATTDILQGNDVVIQSISVLRPQLIQLPIGIIPNGANSFELIFEDDATTGSGATLDIDSIMAVDLTHEDSTVIVLDTIRNLGGGTWPFGATSFDVYVDPLDKQQRYVYGQIGSGDQINVNYRGNALTYLRANAVTVGFLGCYHQYWTIPTTPSSDVNQTFNIHLLSYGGKLIPQSVVQGPPEEVPG